MRAAERTTMNTKRVKAISIAAALAALCVTAPTFADGHGQGGGHAAAGARGGYSHGAGPSGGRMGVAPGRSSGFGGPRGMAPAIRGGDGRYVGGAPRSFSGVSPSRVYAPPRLYNTPRTYSSPRSYSAPRAYNSPRFNSSPAFRAGNQHFAGHAGFSYPAHGASWRPRYWAGGHFHGSYWPRSYYHAGFAWFVPVLPAFYSTFYWGGVPYYYWDNIYYTWSPSDSGYVATDPPPATSVDSSDSGSAQVASGDTSSLYIYPKNGQSEEQTSTDRYECHQWAASQTGFDPTNGANQTAGSAGPSDYRRAMMACLDARGYSAR